MENREPESVLQDRPEKKRGRSSRAVAIVAASVVVLVNVRRVAVDSPWLLLIVGVALVLAFVWYKRAQGGLKEIASQSELREAVSQASGGRRMTLLWYEYVIARNVARGTYHDEPPIEFQSDAYDASTRMGWATKSAKRQLAWLSLFFVVLAVAIPLIVSRDDIEFAVILFIMLAFIFGFGVGAALVVRWTKSRSPLSLLGQRIEAAGVLDSELRWQALLEIARDEMALAPAA